MRKIFFLVAVISLAMVACKKPIATSARPASTPLDGQWRIISVTDNASNITTTKPVSIPNDVDIFFTSMNAAMELLQELHQPIKYGKMAIQQAPVKP